MTVNRFEFIKSNLHCNDKLKCPPNHFQETFSQITPSGKLCIDEQMVPFKGKFHVKQINSQKLKKWGYKIYVLSGIDGVIYNFKIHARFKHALPWSA